MIRIDLKLPRFVRVARAGLAVVALGAASGASAAPARATLEFDGEFSEVVTSSPDCADVFAVAGYHNLHVTTGPTGRTSVLNFQSDVDGAFFAGLNFVGLLGGSNDLFYEKTVARDGVDFAILAEGFVDRSVLYLEFRVEATGAGGPVCTASATYAAFN